MILPLLLTPTVFAADPTDEFLRAEIAKTKAPGVSIAIIKDGKTIKSAGFGFANLETRTPATEETVYELASVTKQFTAAAVLLLAGDGKLSLDDPLSKFVPDVPDAWKPVTVRQLLNHTSGIFSLTALPDYFNPTTIRRDYPPKELIKLVADRPLEFPPGSKFSYSNTGYTLLGLVIESASGKTYADFLAERIFKPLNMTQTRVNDFRAIIPRRAMGYSLEKGGYVNCDYVSPTHPWSAGALVSSVKDLAKWDAALNGETLLTESAKRQMWSPTTLTDGSRSDYGFGWEVSTVRGHRVQQHGGGIPGFSTFILRLPDDKLSVIVLANRDDADAGRLARTIAGRFVPAVAPTEAKPIDDPDPKRTERLRAILSRVAEKGEADESEFTTEFWKFLHPDRLKEAPQMLGGKLSELTLIERHEEDGQDRLTYRAKFGENIVRVMVALTKDGKIAGIGFRPE